MRVRAKGRRAKGQEDERFESVARRTVVLVALAVAGQVLDGDVLRVAEARELDRLVLELVLEHRERERRHLVARRRRRERHLQRVRRLRLDGEQLAGARAREGRALGQGDAHGRGQDALVAQHERLLRRALEQQPRELEQG